MKTFHLRSKQTSNGDLIFFNNAKGLLDKLSWVYFSFKHGQPSMVEDSTTLLSFEILRVEWQKLMQANEYNLKKSKQMNIFKKKTIYICPAYTLSLGSFEA